MEEAAARTGCPGWVRVRTHATMAFRHIDNPTDDAIVDVERHVDIDGHVEDPT